MQKAIGRFRPGHPLLGAAASRIALPFTELFFRWKQIYRSSSHFAAERRRELSAKLENRSRSQPNQTSV